MTTVKCICGADITYEGGQEELFAATRGHCDSVHAELNITDEGIREYMAAARRQTGPTERLESIGEVEVRPVGGNLADFLEFFDHRAFADNVGWASCYCMAHHVLAGEWTDRAAAANRADISARIERGETTGYLGYVGGEVAGWVNATVRRAYPEYSAGDASDETTGSIVCFVIAPPYRRHGVARMLLDAACDGFKERGMTAIEAYPAKAPAFDGAAYHGPLSMLQEAGFEVVKEKDDFSYVVRRVL